MSKPDFAGYVTRYNVPCSDGVTIKPGAFASFDGKRLPLVWDHKHSELSNVLGHVILEHRDDGVYGNAYLNNSDMAQLAGDLVAHGDINAFSIWANKLQKKGQDVLHGILREVSLVLSGANEGAYIDYVSIAHGDGGDVEIEAVIYSDDALIHGSDISDTDQINHKEEDAVTDAVDTAEDTDTDEETIEDILSTLTDKQKMAVEFVWDSLIDGLPIEDDETDDSDDSEEDAEDDVAAGDD